jgi:hypothetical protein
MTTYATMQTRIADELVRDDLASQIREAIQTAITTWEGVRFSFNEKRYALATVASQEYYDWSSMTVASSGAALGTGESLLEIDSTRIEYNGAWYPLIGRTQAYFDDMQVSATNYTGVPVDYTIFGDQLRLSPIPDAAYTITLSGLARLPTLSQDADTNGWMTEGEALIRNQAKVFLCSINGDEPGLMGAQMGLDTARTSLGRKMMAKVNTSRIAAWSL